MSDTRVGVSESIEFDFPLCTIIGHFGDESFQAITCTGTDNHGWKRLWKNRCVQWRKDGVAAASCDGAQVLARGPTVEKEVILNWRGHVRKWRERYDSGRVYPSHLGVWERRELPSGVRGIARKRIWRILRVAQWKHCNIFRHLMGHSIYPVLIRSWLKSDLWPQNLGEEDRQWCHSWGSPPRLDLLPFNVVLVRAVFMASLIRCAH